MKRVSDFLYARASLLNCIIATVAMVAYASLVMGSQSNCFSQAVAEGSGALGLKFGYSYHYVISLFKPFDQDTLLCYRKFVLVWDNLFVLFYGAMYFFWVSFLFKKTGLHPGRSGILNLYPVVMMFMDWSENFFELRIVHHFLENREPGIALVRIASNVNMAKWCFSGLNYLILLSLAIFAVKRAGSGRMIK